MAEAKSHLQRYASAQKGLERAHEGEDEARRLLHVLQAAPERCVRCEMKLVVLLRVKVNKHVS